MISFLLLDSILIKWTNLNICTFQCTIPRTKASNNCPIFSNFSAFWRSSQLFSFKSQNIQQTLITILFFSSHINLFLNQYFINKYLISFSAQSSARIIFLRSNLCFLNIGTKRRASELFF